MHYAWDIRSDVFCEIEYRCNNTLYENKRREGKESGQKHCQWARNYRREQEDIITEVKTKRLSLELQSLVSFLQSLMFGLRSITQPVS